MDGWIVVRDLSLQTCAVRVGLRVMPIVTLHTLHTWQAWASVIMALDARLPSVVHGLGNGTILDVLMPVVTELGNGIVLLGLAIAMYAAGDERTRRYARLAVGAFAVVGLASQLAKHVVGRERPLGGSFDSFPSGHTTEAFCMSWIWGDRWRTLRAPFVCLAALVGFSRVYLMAHYPLDVVAGMALGLAGAAVALAVAHRTPLKAEATGLATRPSRPVRSGSHRR